MQFSCFTLVGKAYVLRRAGRCPWLVRHLLPYCLHRYIQRIPQWRQLEAPQVMHLDSLLLTLYVEYFFM